MQVLSSKALNNLALARTAKTVLRTSKGLMGLQIHLPLGLGVTDSLVGVEECPIVVVLLLTVIMNISLQEKRMQR